MSELTFKTFSELGVREALTNASYVVIENDGDVERFPANSIGKVKTINGMEADDNGNVVIDIPTDEHINGLINAALEVIENGTY